MTPRRLRGLRCSLGHLGVPAPLVHDLGFLAGQDGAAQGLECDALAPVEERAQALVVAGVLVAVVDGHVREVHEGRERIGGVRLFVVGQEALGLLEERLGVLGRGRALCPGQLEVRGRHQEAVLLRGTEGAQHDALGVRGVVVEAMLGSLEAARALGAIVGPQPEGEHGPPGLVHDLLAELDGLGEDDLFLGIEERHLADLLEVHADGVVDADHVLRHGVELGLRGGLVLLVVLDLGRWLLPGLLLALLDADLHAELSGSVEVASAQFLLVLGHDGVPVHVTLAALKDRSRPCCQAADQGAGKERPCDPGQGRLQAGHEGAAVEGSLVGSSLLSGLESLPELTCRCRHEGVLGHAGGGGIQVARVGEEQAQQRRLRRLQGALHGARIERVRLGHDGLQVDARTDVAIVTSTASPSRCRLRSAQGLKELALLHAGAAGQQLHVPVPTDGSRWCATSAARQPRAAHGQARCAGHGASRRGR